MPPAVIFKVREAGVAAVLAVGDVMGLAARGRLVAAAQLVVIHPLDNHTSWPAIV